MNSDGEIVPNLLGLLDAALFAIAASGLAWWLHRAALSRLWTSSSKLWIASLVSYVLADSFYFVVSFVWLARPEVRDGSIIWIVAIQGLLPCLLATAIGSIMRFAWLVQSLVNRRRKVEFHTYRSKEWLARALTLLCLGIPCVLMSFVFTFIIFWHNPSHIFWQNPSHYISSFLSGDFVRFFVRGIGTS